MSERGEPIGARHGFSVAFCASTGRTATMFVAKTLNRLPGVTATHEGHLIGDEVCAILPLVNFHNRKAWYDRDYASEIVRTMRSPEIFRAAAGDAPLFVDVAFNNAPLMEALMRSHPTAAFFAIFRRCESFVRSATIVTGEDTQPAGWPDRQKPLTDREKFIEIGRLKPAADSEFGAHWKNWSAIQRNIWLWSTVNFHLFELIRQTDKATHLIFEDLSDAPSAFWGKLLAILGQDTPENLAQCVAASTRKANQRAAYQIGPLEEWSKAEKALYEQLAVPLEEKIYAR